MIFSTSSGKMLRDIEFNTSPSENPGLIPYIQSLRGDPFADFSLTALVA
jgi:hypothetical protein